jgi:tetratricopeptide (TPR) repeat protein
LKRISFLLFSIAILIACSNSKSEKETEQKNPNFLKAVKYRDNHETDSAFKYYNTAKEEFLLQKDSLYIAKCLVNMAIIATEKGDHFGGQELSLNAFAYLNQNDKSYYSSIRANFNNLGIANYKLRNYSEALKFYDNAIKFADNSNDKFVYLNNKAKAYEELRNYKDAIEIYTQVITSSEKNSSTYAMALANLASAKWLQNVNYNAAPELRSALFIHEQNHELFGQNFCFARLADFYSEKNNSLAVSYANKMYVVARELNSPIDKLEALYKLVKLSSPQQSKQYFFAYEKLDDSLQLARANAKNQFALIRYNTLKLEKDNAEKEYQLTKQKIIIYEVVTVGCLIGIFLTLWYRKRKKVLQKEKELEVKKTELRYVKKVHDRVANKIYNTMMEVENADDIDRKTIADKLESIYNISRDISYESNEIDHRLQFAHQLSQMLNNYSSGSIEIIINGNGQELWLDVGEDIKSEIIILLQELMTNMMKHSQATVVQLLFKRIENQIQIDYIDNGIGVEGKPLYKNGLTNTGNRITDINGTINFDTTVSKGLKIEISFPVI